MNKLFNSKNVRWNGVEYEQIETEDDLRIAFEDDNQSEEELDANINENL